MNQKKTKARGAPLRLLALIIFTFSTSQFYLQTMVGFQGSAWASFPGLPTAKINGMDMVLCNIDIFLHHYILQTKSCDCYFKIWLYQISGNLEEVIFFYFFEEMTGKVYVKEINIWFSLSIISMYTYFTTSSLQYHSSYRTITLTYPLPSSHLAHMHWSN